MISTSNTNLIMSYVYLIFPPSVVLLVWLTLPWSVKALYF